MHHCFTLANGLRLLIEELPHTHSASLGCFVGVGAGHEARPTCGISHFIEHMLFKGSQQRPTPKLISEAIEGVGGLLEAYTDFESTTFYAKVADIHFDHALDVLADMLLHPRLNTRDVEKERRVITEELRETADTPSELVHLLLDRAMWGDQPLGRDVAGDEQSVAAITHDDVLNHWRTQYVAENMIISVAGNVRAGEVVPKIERAFETLPHGAPPAFQPSQPPQPGPALHLLADDSEQGNFALGFPGLGLRDPDRRAQHVFDMIIGGGMSSRLFQEIREERGLAYTVGSYTREHHDTGKWIVYGSVEPQRLAEGIAAVLEQLRSVQHDGITEEELRRIKEQVKGGMLLALEDTWSVAARNGAHLLRYGQVIPVKQVIAEIETVTCEDVLRVARRVLREDAMHLAVIGPYEDAEDVQALLRLS